ncbi:TetR/AcrR family transcriptional regulator [Flavobacterium ginsenosidimutans]|uniref:TetR/AcrR family transcriptional regulator n=1 Tax=Flavobacterium ginsenosidimutans TaxID=687844 RepID=UPI003D985AA8
MSRKQYIDENTITAPLLALLDIAEELFAEQGYAGTTIRQIAGAAKVNSATVNYYFGSKEALYNLIFTLRLQELSKAMDAVHFCTENLDKFEMFLNQYISHIQSYKNFHKLLLREYSLLSSQELDSSIISRHIFDNLKLLQQIVTGHQSSGSNLKIDITLFCVNVIVLTPRLVLENRSPFNLIDVLEGTESKLPIIQRIKKYFYSQLCD